MASQIITGQVSFINAPVTNQQGYTSRTALVVVEPGQYQTHLPVEFSGNSLALADQLQQGLTYNFHVNIRGSKNPLPSTKVQGQYVAFTTLSVWKVEAAQNTGIPQPQAQQPYTPQPQQGGYMGAPQGQPQQQGFPQPTQAAPQQTFPQQGQPQGFPAPNQQPAPAQQPFGQPAQNAGQPFGVPAQGFPQP